MRVFGVQLGSNSSSRAPTTARVVLPLDEGLPADLVETVAVARQTPNAVISWLLTSSNEVFGAQCRVGAAPGGRWTALVARCSGTRCRQGWPECCEEAGASVSS